jgi:hypothetical protein
MWHKSVVGAVIAAVGASLSTAVAILAPHSPEWTVSAILLAGVTALGVGLGVHSSGNNRDKE